ncbi:MAG TPA: chaperonin GroEL, partial [Acetobacteraceae bacterium]|nr:chaperonin GroEL [Acetobacteraceae bacterium]
DGTTTATVLADALVQHGLARLGNGTHAVGLVRGLERAASFTGDALRRSARPLAGPGETRAVAVLAANDEATGDVVAEALARVGPAGIIGVEFGATVRTTLDVADGMSFDRGYLSHHMVTDVERMQAVLEDALILMTDQKLQSAAEVAAIEALLEGGNQPLLLIAEEVAPAAVTALLKRRERGLPQIAAIHPPEYGNWRKAMLEDLAILTGGRVIARDLGGSLLEVERRDLGRARQVRVGASRTSISGPGGDPQAVHARREQVRRQIEVAPPNVERDKLAERLAKLSGGAATILVGGATPVEQKRRAQLVEDAVNAARAAIEEGVVPGGGTALLQVAPELDGFIAQLDGSEREGAVLLRHVLAAPLAAIASNCGLDAEAVVGRVAQAPRGTGYDARSGAFTDLLAAGVMDPVRVTTAALQNAVSVAGLILTTQTLIADRREHVDPTAGPALGGGAERLGRA